MTWDHAGSGFASGSSTQLPSAASSGHIPISTPEVIDPAQPFEPAGFDLEGVRTLVTPAAFELRPRFIGRTEALGQLHDLTRTAFEGGGLGFAVLIGEPGMGKSRIIHELAARIRSEHPATRLFHGIADENAHAYGPVARALTARFGILAGEAPAAIRDRLVAELAEVIDPERLTEVAHLVAHLLRVPFDDSPIVTPLLGSPQRLEARLFMALKRLLAAESERYPLLVVIEHLEQCGTDTINFLHYLAAGLRDHRVVILGTATSALQERHPAFGEGEAPPLRIAVEPLSPDEAEDLLRELCKRLGQVPALVSEHVRRMARSPRAICELVRLLLETGGIVREAEAWRTDDAALAAITLPTTYEELALARLAVMPPADRGVLEMCAAVGDTSWLDAILALTRHGLSGSDPDGPTLAQIAGSSDQSRGTVVTAIGALVEHGWLLEVPHSSIAGERELRFANPHLWSIVYQAIAEPTRQRYHAVVARWLELHPEGGMPSAQEGVARHLVLAGEYREAAVRYRRAAEAARDTYANLRAIELFDRALACIGGEDPAARIALWNDLASVYELVGNFDAALGAFERMLRLSWVLASKATAATAFGHMGRVWRRKGDLGLALEYLERGLELFRGAGDARGIAGSLDDIGRAQHLLGRRSEAEANITEALARHSRDGDPRALATSLSRLGHLHQDRGHYEAARDYHRSALEIRTATGDRWGQIVARTHLAALALELGELAEARAGWLAALSEAEAIGALPLSALVLTCLGEVALAEGKLDEARRRLDDALELIEDQGDRGLETVCCRHLATLEKRHGNTRVARALAQRALAVAQRAGLRKQEAEAYMTLGEVCSASLHDDAAGELDGPSPAAAAFASAVEIAASLGHEAVLARALFVLGRYQAELGAQAKAKDVLRDSLMMFSKLGLERQAREVERLLASMN